MKKIKFKSLDEAYKNILIGDVIVFKYHSEYDKGIILSVKGQSENEIIYMCYNFCVKNIPSTEISRFVVGRYENINSYYIL